ncbi:MAG: GNAT family N-acetyltransferase [Sphingomonadaceae bacterium]|nr:GNAT family N-acetyltransferase [Sphingomonadaceae bacterium]
MTSPADTESPPASADQSATPGSVRGLSNDEATAEWRADLTTRSGVTFHVRPAKPGDEEKLADFFLHVSSEDIYRRFLTGLIEVDRERLRAMARDDDLQSIDFLALDENSNIIATAMLSADADFEIGEFALCTRQDRKHQGVSWTLLGHLIRYAQAKGLRKIRSIESWDDRAALQLEGEMGFDLRHDPDDSTLMIAEKTLIAKDRTA